MELQDDSGLSKNRKYKPSETTAPSVRFELVATGRNRGREVDPNVFFWRLENSVVGWRLASNTAGVGFHLVPCRVCSAEQAWASPFLGAWSLKPSGML